MDHCGWQMEVSKLGECRVPSPMDAVQYVTSEDRVLYDHQLGPVRSCLEAGKVPPSFELAGPRRQIFFPPADLRCGIVTCGGLCPGLNDVIRAIVLSLHFHYGAGTVYGFRFGYEGLTFAHDHEPLLLTPAVVDGIHDTGGTILGSSRGPQDVAEMVDYLQHRGVGILFVIGGDGTLRGGHAISEEVARRGLKIAVVGVPKTIDNDIAFVAMSFGFQTAGAEARRVVAAANSEAEGARNGIGLVKLMGRDSGWIAAYAAVANSEVNFCLVPEVPFTLEGFLAALEARLQRRGHAVIVVAEGAGQDLITGARERDASGNLKHGDIGQFLRERILEHCKAIGRDVTLKYIDPSYTIRSVPANAYDSAFCFVLGQNAVHAGMAGCTDVVIGHWHNHFTHVPIPLAVSARKKLDPDGPLWNNVVACTGQPKTM